MRRLRLLHRQLQRPQRNRRPLLLPWLRSSAPTAVPSSEDATTSDTTSETRHRRSRATRLPSSRRHLRRHRPPVCAAGVAEAAVPFVPLPPPVPARMLRKQLLPPPPQESPRATR